jgi:uncharacterized membrane protein required for colicin V production
MTYWIISTIAIFAGISMTSREGLWSNTITLVNIIISGLVAFGFYSPIVVYLDESFTSGQHTYWLDFAIIWAVFCATMVILRFFTGAFSKTKLRFKNPIDPIGGPIVGFIAAWWLAAFVMATLHTAPMPKDSFNLVRSDEEIASESSFSNPDLAWLRFFFTMTGENSLGFANTTKSGWVNNSVRIWVKVYENHRAAFEKSPSFRVKRG